MTSNTATALDRTSAVVDSQLTLRVGYGRDKRKAARRAALISHAVVAGYMAVDRHLVLICFWRYAKKPMPANPTINNAHVEGSETAEMVSSPPIGRPSSFRRGPAHH